jgi:hypothetical protein
MGIHLPHDPASGANFTEEELEMRTRLYWSAYCWDKTISLTLGREPALLCRPGHTPDGIQDESDDAQDWVPNIREGPYAVVSA